MITTIERLKFIGVFMSACISLYSCRYTTEDAKDFLPGQYFYEIPSGEFQILTISPDFTFKQTVYSPKNKNILYQNTGKMSVKGKNIDFSNWLECYELADQKMLIEPHIVFSTGNYWRKPERDEGVLIVKFDQTNYIFRKQKK